MHPQDAPAGKRSALEGTVHPERRIEIVDRYGLQFAQQDVTELRFELAIDDRAGAANSRRSPVGFAGRKPPLEELVEGGAGSHGGTDAR
ncbi:MAG: hypothetical protein QOH48_2258 [Actinomycetota bacterium]|nr:hypothetical protein [Actinomycetota bacterium]